MKFDDKHHPKGETLPTSTRVFRVKVVRAFLKSGTPLNWLEYFREVFEEAGFSLTSHSHMRQLIPFILEEENSTISKEVTGKDVSIILDWTTRDGEALVLLLCFVDEWELKVRLVHFQLVKSSVCGDELAWIVIEVLHRKLGVLQGQLLAAMRDRAAVNTRALRTVCSLSRHARCGLYLPFSWPSQSEMQNSSPYSIYVYMECYFHHKHEGQTSVEPDIFYRSATL